MFSMSSELDVLLTAVVSGPVTIAASRWLPAVWGNFEPTWHSVGNHANVELARGRAFTANDFVHLRHALDQSPNSFLFIESTFTTSSWCEDLLLRRWQIVLDALAIRSVPARRPRLEGPLRGA